MSRSNTPIPSVRAETARALPVPDRGPAPRRRWPPGAELLLIAALCIQPYMASLRNGFVYDDVVLIVARPAPASLGDALSVFTRPYHPSGLPYYRPLAALTLAAQQAIWGNAPLAYHLFNLLLLLGAAFAARALFRALPVAGMARGIGASVCAVLLAWHPLVSSVVHAISGRETLLALALMTTACWAFLHEGRRWFVSSLALLGAALLCKEQAIALPALFVLADWLELTPDSPRRRAAKGWSAQATAWIDRYVLVVLVVLVYLVLRSRVLSALPESSSRHLQLALLQAPGRPLFSLIYFLQTTFLPTVDLRYEPHLPAWWSTWRFLGTAALTAGLALLALQAGAARRRLLWFFAGWALVTLAPSANILAQETHFDDRYVVLPYLGALGFLLTLASELWVHRPLRAWIGAGAAACLVAFGVISHHRGQSFADDYAFLTQWARSDPTSYQARASLAEYHKNRAEYAEAAAYEQEALRLIHAQLPEPQCVKRHFALAEVLTRLGRNDEAAAQYEEILRLRPGYAGARRLLAEVRSKAAAPKLTALTPGGGLSQESRERLLERLSAPDLAGRPVWLAAASADPRALRLQTELEALFRKAGWEVRGADQVSFRVKPGLFILAAEEQAPPYAAQLQQALADVGLPVGTFARGYRAYAKEMSEKQPGWSGFRLAPEQEYVLVIGRLGE